MQGYLKQELKRAFLSHSTCISIILVISSVLIGAIESYIFPDPNNNAFNLLIQGYSGGTSSILALLFPLFVSIPFVSSYITDINTGYIKYIITRMKLINYVIIRLFVNGLVGGFVLSIGLSVSFLIFIFLKGTSSSEIYTQITILKGAFSISPFLFVLLMIFNAFVCGLIFATFGLGISTFLKNKYISVLFPFIYYIISGTLLVKIHPHFHAVIPYILDYVGSTISTVVMYDLLLFFIGVTAFLIGVFRNAEKDL